MTVEGAHSVVGDLSQTGFTPVGTDFARFVTPYRAGISALTAKINILKGELSHVDRCCPIQYVTSRVKSHASILEKAARIGCPPTQEDVRDNILDIAGVRVICSLVSDAYRTADALSRQADITVLEVEDYIAHPKPNGYRSFHMTVEIPVLLSDRVERVPVELQIRTLAMDSWAILEHRIYHKYQRAVPQRPLNELIDAADAAHRLDLKLARLFEEAADLTTEQGSHPLNETRREAAYVSTSFVLPERASASHENR